MEAIGIDFETYGSVDLKKHGLDRYVRDPFFRPLLCSYYYLEDDNLRVHRGTLDFVEDFEGAFKGLEKILPEFGHIIAHNAGFEAAVCDWLGLGLTTDRFIDSAVVARAAGASGTLASAAPQLLNVDKMAAGQSLIKVFSIPGEYQEANGSLAFDPLVVEANPVQWKQFGVYCELDAELGHDIVLSYRNKLSPAELRYMAITMDMNQRGWHVDVAAVQEMQRRYLENQELALFQFRESQQAPGLNLGSGPQMKAWCAERGVKAVSFDEKHVAAMQTLLQTKLAGTTVPPEKRGGYESVLALLETKQILGGSSLKKLQVILNTVGPDNVLRDQYLHCGAGQTLRTTGRSVQMQNLKRLHDPRPMDSLFDDDEDWSNTAMAENLRQLFTSSDPNGKLIVGDFKSVESRGLAWLAGEEWKLEAYRMGQDMYKVLAEKIYSTGYDMVTGEQRRTGKVGELSCGYGAGPPAVLEFAKNMGVEMSEGESVRLVCDWRDANPMVVKLWAKLDDMLHQVLAGSSLVTHPLPDGFSLMLHKIDTPASLLQQLPGVQSIEMVVFDSKHQTFLRRIFHGCYLRGRDVNYVKPSDRKTGDQWSVDYVNPKTKHREFYKIYGGKLSGILTQSFCRELFFQSLREVDRWTKGRSNVALVGQFHDEIVLDWTPLKTGPSSAGAGLDVTAAVLERFMSDPGSVKSFPLDAEIKYDYRYIK